MFRRILAPIDASDHSRRVIPIVRDLAEKYGSEVLVFHVRERELGIKSGVHDTEDPGQAESLVDGVVREIGTGGANVRGDVQVAVGDPPAKLILDEAASFQADLIVMGSRGLSDWSGLLLGSVTHKVMHLATCPVLVAR